MRTEFFTWTCRLTLAFLAFGCLQGSGQGLGADTPGTREISAVDPVIKAGEKITLDGKLQGGLMGIGGETTGWQVTYVTSKGKEVLEVDMSAIKDADALDGKMATVSGTVFLKKYIERGDVLILKAETAEVSKGGK